MDINGGTTIFLVCNYLVLTDEFFFPLGTKMDKSKIIRDQNGYLLNKQ